MSVPSPLPSASFEPAAEPRTRSERIRRIRTRTVLQMEPVESGAASLAMVLGHHGGFLGLQKLRALCGVTRDGSTPQDLVGAARALGLTAVAQETSASALPALTPPAILLWDDHFVVYEGSSGSSARPVVHLNDPAAGRRRMTLESFRTRFTGTALTFGREPGFQPMGRPPRSVRELLVRQHGVRQTLAACMIASLLLLVASTVSTVSTKAFIDTFLRTTYSRPAGAFFTVMGSALALIVVLAVLQQRYLLRVELWINTRDSVGFVRHLLRLPVDFLHHRKPADLAQRLGLNDSIAQVLGRRSVSVLTSGVTVVAYVLLLGYYSPLLAAIGLSGSLLKVALARLMVRLRRDAVARSRQARARLMATAYSGVQMMETLKATAGEAAFFRRWGGDQAALLHEQQRLAMPPTLITSVASVVGSLTTVGILLVGGLQAMQGGVPVGVLIAFMALLPAMTRPIDDIIGVVPAVQEASADLAMLLEVHSADQDEVFDRMDAGDLSRRLGGHVRVDDVAFGYTPTSRPLIEHISFEVGPGQQVALVGRSGSGKSTVAKVLVGLYPRRSGEVLIGGKPIDSVPRSLRAASVAFVDQEVFLFQGSVRDNVTLWDPSISDEAVALALADACLEDLVTQRPGGIHGFVDQDGRNFSGGQRQRLELARALVRHPSILVLDEATSALDAKTENRISVNLRRRGCACVVIAHRLSTVRDSDEILVLDGGAVVERGTHDELERLGGSYAAMIKEEFDG